MDKKVIIYTQETCGPCHAEKEWLKEHNIDFEERDIRKNAAYMNEAIELGASQTPVTVIEGNASKEVVMGFNQEKLSSLLGL
ncbi:glutaredoxin family protein [Bacillus taeanensis]|uniref:Glutaredoxin family protein n=1 Tax=Bacillus taeanensis TaxID=273032 RepID=A0A366XZ55_9BACI|nr:glutaredoxin domain-containing protein [Bacillus taeanensis]RBW69433.1 glutaredoxin family protein [Bacillus taeanensis]